MTKDILVKEKLLQVAKEEFLEKGYNDSSLRNICKKANVTTGALYFSFKNKEDLFSNLVDKALNDLYNIMNKHYEKEKNIEGFSLEINDHINDIEIAHIVINYLYDHYEEAVLLISKSQGSKYENFLDRFIEITEEHYRSFIKSRPNIFKLNLIDDYTIHWFAHVHINSFVEVITHNLTREQAINHANILVEFFVQGWKSMLN